MRRLSILLTLSFAAYGQTALSLREAVSLALQDPSSADRRRRADFGTAALRPGRPASQFAGCFSRPRISVPTVPPTSTRATPIPSPPVSQPLEPGESARRQDAASASSASRSWSGNCFPARSPAGCSRPTGTRPARSGSSLLVETAEPFNRSSITTSCVSARAPWRRPTCCEFVSKANGSLTANTAGLEAERARIQLFREMGQTQVPGGVLLATCWMMRDAAAADAALGRWRTRTEVQAGPAGGRAGSRPAAFGAGLRPARSGRRSSATSARPVSTPCWAGVQIGLPLTNRNQGNIAPRQASFG